MGMNQAHLAVSMLLAILVAEHQADPFGPLAPVVTQDSIKASREKTDREMKLNTKRPWDGMDLTGPRALEKRPEPVVNQE
jgi:hypothetical protein